MPEAVNTPRRTRREQAAATRERIVRSAIDVFTEAGYVGARMGDIASRAGVAVQTVYFTFHTKSELLQACVDFAVLGPARVPPLDQPFWSDVLAARSGRAALDAFVNGNTAILVRVAAIREVADSAQHEPDAAAVVTLSERLRREGLGRFVEILADRFGLRAGLDRADALDVLLMLTSHTTYLTLRRYGWSDDKYEAWLSGTLAGQLLARPARRKGW